MAGRSEMSDDALDAALAGAFKAHPFDARFAAKVAAAARASGAATPRREPARVAPARAERREAHRLSARTFAIAAGLLVAAGLALRLFAPSSEPAPRAVVTVATLIDGDGALVIRGANTSSGLAGEKTPLRDGDRVRAERLPVRVALADGSEVKLHPETTIEVHGDHVEMVGAGAIFAAVTPRANGGPRLSVTIEGVPLAIYDIGTRFGVEYDGASVSASVLEGSVALDLDPARALDPLDTDAERRTRFTEALVKAGERITVLVASLARGPEGASVARGPARLDRDLGWAVGAIAKSRPPEPPQPPTVMTPVAPPPVSPETTEPPTRSSNADLPIGAPPLPQGQ